MPTKYNCFQPDARKQTTADNFNFAKPWLNILRQRSEMQVQRTVKAQDDNSNKEWCDKENSSSAEKREKEPSPANQERKEKFIGDPYWLGNFSWSEMFLAVFLYKTAFTLHTVHFTVQRRRCHGIMK